MAWSDYGLPVSGRWCMQDAWRWQAFYDLLNDVRDVEANYITSVLWHNSGVGSPITLTTPICGAGVDVAFTPYDTLFTRAAAFRRRMIDWDYIVDGNPLDEDFSELLIDESPTKFWNWVRAELDGIGAAHTIIDALEDELDGTGPDYRFSMEGCMSSLIPNSIWAMCEVLRKKWAVLWSSQCYSTRNDMDQDPADRDYWMGESAFSSNPCDTVRQQAATDWDGNGWGMPPIYTRPLTEVYHVLGGLGRTWRGEWQRQKYTLDDMVFPSGTDFLSFEYVFYSGTDHTFVNLSGEHGNREISRVKTETLTGTNWISDWINDNPSSINPLNHGSPVLCPTEQSWGYFGGVNLAAHVEFDEP